MVVPWEARAALGSAAPLLPFLQRSSGRADGLNLDLHLHVIADQHPPCLERRIPDQPELAAIDLGGSAEAHAAAAPGILAGALVDRVESDFLRDAANREVADHLERLALLAPRAFHSAALEADGRMLLDVQEVRRAQVLVAVRGAGVQAPRVQRGP